MYKLEKRVYKKIANICCEQGLHIRTYSQMICYDFLSIISSVLSFLFSIVHASATTKIHSGNY